MEACEECSRDEMCVNPDCLFCKIVAGDIPCFKVYEDDLVLAFLDVFSSNEGHCLVIPKCHKKDLLEMCSNALERISVVSRDVGRLLKEKLGCERVNLMVIGEDVPHFHLHVIPRYKGDKIKLNLDLRSDMISKKEGEKVLEKLRD